MTSNSNSDGANNANQFSERYLWFDTDSGTDDMTALLLLTSAINNPGLYQNSRWSLLGLSTVFGNVSLTQATTNLINCANYLKLDKTIPIYEGSARSLLFNHPINTWPGHGHNGIGGAEFSEEELSNNEIPRQVESSQHAALALIDCIKNNPNKLDVIAVGPLTNIALAITLFPQFPLLIRSLSIMGGTINGRGNISPLAEFNFFKDPEAAHIVFEAFNNLKCSPILLAPIELTEDFSFSWKEFSSLIKHETRQAKFLQQIYDANQKWSATFIENNKNNNFINNNKNNGTSDEKDLRELAKNFTSHDEEDEILASHPHSVNHRMQPCDAYIVACLLEPSIIQSMAKLYGKIVLTNDDLRGACAYDWHYHNSSQRTNNNNNESVVEEVNNHGTISIPKNVVNVHVVRTIQRDRMFKMLERSVGAQ